MQNNILKQVLIGLAFFWIPLIMGQIDAMLLTSLLLVMGFVLFIPYLAGWYSILVTAVSAVLAGLLTAKFGWFSSNNQSNMWYIDIAFVVLGAIIYAINNRVSLLVTLSLFYSAVTGFVYVKYISTYSNFYLFLEGELKALFFNNQSLESPVNVDFTILSKVLPFILMFSAVVLTFSLVHISNFVGSHFKLTKKIHFSLVVPKIYNYFWIIFALFTIFIHRMLDNNDNLYYTMYNIMFMLLLPYVYSGFAVVSRYVFNTALYNKYLVYVSMLVFVVFMFIFIWYVLFAVCILGFLKETAIIKIG